jgi:O-antigen/teichoic acid export membrane protein
MNSNSGSGVVAGVWSFLLRGGQVFALRIFGAAIGFFVNIVLARALGTHGAGVIYLALTITTIAAVLGRFGLDVTLLRFISVSVSQRDWPRTAELYRKGITIVLFASALVSSFVILSAGWLASNIFSQPDLVVPLRILALGILPLAVLHTHAELLKAVRWLRSAIFVQSVGAPLLAIFLLPPLATALWVSGAASALVLSYVSMLVIGLLIWRRATPDLLHVGVSQTHQRLLTTALPLLVIAIMNVVIDMTDTLMIGIFLDAHSVGIFGVAQRTAAVSALLLVTVNSAIAPKFAALWEEGARAETARLARQTTRAMAVIAGLILLVIWVFSSVILALFGSEFVEGETVLMILAVGQFMVLATGPVAYLLMMTGHERFHRNNVVFSAALNIVLNVILIPKYGIEGAALATAASLTIKNVIAVLYVRQKLGIRVLF